MLLKKAAMGFTAKSMCWRLIFLLLNKDILVKNPRNGA
jgi:hypothetical protein